MYKLIKGKKGFAKKYGDGVASGYNFIALELLGKSLASILSTRKMAFSLPTVLKIGHDLVSKLEELHKLNIVHSDIKADNVTIGLNNSSNLYLIDFGLAQTINSTAEADKQPEKIAYIVGTRNFMSVGAHKGLVSFKNDMESLAILLVYLHSKKLPWEKYSQNEMQAILDAKKKYFFLPPQSLPRPIYSFIRAIGKMTRTDPLNYDLLRKVLK